MCGDFKTDRELVINQRSWSDMTEYMKRHFSSKLGCGPLLPVPDDAVLDEVQIVCVLHLALRLVGNLYQWTIRSNIKTDKQASAVNFAMGVMGIHMPKASKQEKKDMIEDKLGKKPSLMGRDCKKLTDGGFQSLLKAVELLAADLKQATDLWEALAALIQLVGFTFDAPADMFKKDEATIDKRKAHAEKTRQAAGLYKRLWMLYTKAPSRVPLYVHVAEVHIPRMMVPVGSVSRFAMQGEEHLHSQRKRDRKTRASHKKVGSKGRRKKDGTYTTVTRGKHETQIGIEAIRRTIRKQMPLRPKSYKKEVYLLSTRAE